MNVKALYPSIDVDFAIDKCLDIIMEGNAEFRNVDDIAALGLFIPLICKGDVIIRYVIHKYFPTRLKSMRGRKPKLTASGTSRNIETRWSGWIECQPKTNTLHQTNGSFCVKCNA